MSNRLAAEPSPYLLQHADNPVDWYPWGEEAFERARREDKPIFLSVGYSTCHWCHVMEHESFESPEIAAVLNEYFVSIKVDREERPDLDRVYMTFVQATTGSGGWPMSVWLTPDLKPFFGGTYFPPTSRWGRPGFAEILREIGRMWKEDRARVVESADTLLDRLRGAHGLGAGLEAGRAAERGSIAGPGALAAGVEQFARAFDRRRGGFGEAPKFPRPSELLFLLREHARTGDAAAREMVVAALGAMALGGMRDHLGGGFHRYSVDADWRVPHFEKMLYDQAQLVLAYLEAAQACEGTQAGMFASVAEDTLEYVRRDMTHPSGAFYSAEDADSVPPEHAGEPETHKTEGAFYLWRASEIGALLGDDADVVRFRFGIEPTGNAPVDPQGEFGGKNLVYIARDIEDVARLSGRTADEVVAALGRARQALFDARSRRPRPHRDDKILTAWNGLMIAAFARAARVLGPRSRLNPEGGDRGAVYLVAARRAASFILTSIWDAGRAVLQRRHRDGQTAIDGYAEDYAFFIWGLVELFQADGDPAWLEWAVRLQARQDELFWDPVEGGWFSTTGSDASVLLRLKEDYDGAEPSASSVSVLNVLWIGHLTGDAAAAETVERTLGRYGQRLEQAARIVPMMMCGLATFHAGLQQIVIVGRRDAPETQAMLGALAERYAPFAIIVGVEPGARQAALARLAPFVGPKTLREGRATAYVCRDFACREPVTTVEDLRRVLAG